MLQKLRQRYSRDTTIIIYKLLHDFLFLWLAFFTFALIADGLITGIVSSRMGLYMIALILLVTVFLIHQLVINLQIKSTTKINKKIAGSLFFLSMLIIFNSLIKLPLMLSLFILIVVFVMFYFLLKVFQEK